MATSVAGATQRASLTAVTWVDRALAVGAVIILGMAAVGFLRGSDDWDRLPLSLFAHLATIGVALALTPVMLLRRRGDRLHRRLGYVWAAAMLVTALVSFNLRFINDGSFSPIHILSLFTAIQVPLLVWRARQHQVAQHRQAVRLMVLGALLIAGGFTFPFNRMLGGWLFAPMG
jgi:uncharacterized membrane protein